MKREHTACAASVDAHIVSNDLFAGRYGGEFCVVFGITCQSAVDDPSKLSLSKFALQVGTTFLNKQVKKS